MEMSGILGRKLGMTQIFDAQGTRVSVTLIEAGPCLVLKAYPKGLIQKVQLGFRDFPKESADRKCKKPQLGMFKKLNVKPKRFIREVQFSPDKALAIGSEVKADIFKEGDFVNITGTSIGKGFQGGMKRYHWAGGFKTHGSTSHRRMGSVGANTYPGRVFKGHRMPGHMGNRRITVKNLKVIRVEPNDNLLVVRGAVVGHDENYLIIQKSRKVIKFHAQPVSAKAAKKDTKSKPKA